MCAFVVGLSCPRMYLCPSMLWICCHVAVLAFSSAVCAVVLASALWSRVHNVIRDLPRIHMCRVTDGLLLNCQRQTNNIYLEGCAQPRHRALVNEI